jgi:hypothetical protein
LKLEAYRDAVSAGTLKAARDGQIKSGQFSGSELLE